MVSTNPWQPWQNLLKRRGRQVKTPTLLQMEAVECGAAALGIILAYYRRIVPLPELRQACGVSRDGSKAANILKAARVYGLEAKGYKKELEQLQDLRPPYIVFWDFNHFLVVEGIRKRRVYLNDPATGPRTVSFQEFDEGYTGIVLVMEPSREFVKGGRKPSLILALGERLRTAAGALAYCVLAGFLLTLVGMVVPVFSQVFVDEILVQGRQQWLRPLLIGMAFATILQGLLTLLRLRYLRRLKIKLSVGMSSRFLWHILRLPVNFYAQRYAGEISNRTSLNDQVADVLSGQLASTVIDAVMVIFYALVMIQYDKVLTAIIASFLLPVNNLVSFGSTLQELEGNMIRLDDVLSNSIDPQVERGRFADTGKRGHKDAGTSQKTLSPFSTSVPKLQGYGETELLKVDQECFRELVANADARVVGLIEGWIEKVGSVLFDIATPAIQVKAEKQARFSLIDGQTLQLEPDTVSWVRIQQGKVRWIGFAALTFTTASGIVPLSHQMWLEAEGSVQLVTEITSAIRKSDLLLQGLSQLHTQLLDCIHILQERERTEELQRLQAQEQLNNKVTAEALGELASTLGTRKTEYLLDDSPLLVAAGAVGKALGVAIHPPGKWENLKRVKEPLEAIMRASRIRMRQVLLRDDWWKKDSGPLIAYTREDNQLVVLLPSKATRYEIFDPVKRTRSPVNARNAATLVPSAYMFYRSLPDKALKSLELVQFALKGRGRELLVIVLTGIAAALLGMLTPQATAILMDNAIPDSDRSLLLQVGIGLLAAAVGTALFQLTQGIAILRIETVSDASTQAALWDRLLNLPVSFFRQYTIGDLQSRVSSISQIRRQLGGTTVIKLVGALFTFLNLGLLFYYSVKLALVAVVVALIAIAVTTISGLLLLRKTRPLLELQGNIFGQTVQLINGISKLRVAGAEERAFATWSKNYSRQVKFCCDTQCRYQWYSQ